MRQGLLAIADAKATQLETFIRERRGRPEHGQPVHPYLVDAIPKLAEIRRKETLDSAVYVEVGSAVRPFMANFVDSFGYSNAFLFDTDGTAAVPAQARSGRGIKPLERSAQGIASWPKSSTGCARSLQTEVSDYQMYTRDGSEPAAFIASSVFSAEGRIVGFVVLEAEQRTSLPCLQGL